MGPGPEQTALTLMLIWIQDFFLTFVNIATRAHLILVLLQYVWMETSLIL